MEGEKTIAGRSGELLDVLARGEVDDMHTSNYKASESWPGYSVLTVLRRSWGVNFI